MGAREFLELPGSLVPNHIDSLPYSLRSFSRKAIIDWKACGQTSCGELDLAARTVLPPLRRRWIAAHVGEKKAYFLDAPEFVDEICSTEGLTRKLLLRLRNMVLIGMGESWHNYNFVVARTHALRTHRVEPAFGDRFIVRGGNSRNGEPREHGKERNKAVIHHGGWVETIRSGNGSRLGNGWPVLEDRLVSLLIA